MRIAVACYVLIVLSSNVRAGDRAEYLDCKLAREARVGPTVSGRRDAAVRLILSQPTSDGAFYAVTDAVGSAGQLWQDLGENSNARLLGIRRWVEGTSSD